MDFPNIDPIIFQIGPFALRWYSLAYVAGLLIGLAYMCSLTSKFSMGIGKDDLSDFLTWAVIGVIIGGRFGYVFFYKPEFFFTNPTAIIQVWKGGMSFHGGVIGVGVAMIVYARRKKLELLKLSDLVAVATPIGLFFGRLANFINGELFGRVSDVPWAIVFPRGGPYPRHPSQLYEAALEGLLLFVLLNVLVRFKAVRQYPGVLTAIFLIGYAVSRVSVEMYRSPDVHIGYLIGGSTMGQWLSLPMAALGIFLIYRARQKSLKT